MARLRVARRNLALRTLFARFERNDVERGVDQLLAMLGAPDARDDCERAGALAPALA